MVFGCIVSAPRGNLSLQQSLKLANVYLENANKEQDPEIALVLCHDTEVSLNQAKKVARRSKNQEMHRDIATAYTELGKVLDSKGYGGEAQASYKKAEKWESPVQEQGQQTQSSDSKSNANANAGPASDVAVTGNDDSAAGVLPTSPKNKQRKQAQNAIATIPKHIFADDVSPPIVITKLPEPDERLASTPQLACSLSLLGASYSLNEVLEPVARDWLQGLAKDEDEGDRLNNLAVNVVQAYIRDEIKDSKVVAEVVCLAPVLDKEVFRQLLDDFYAGIRKPGLLKPQLLDGLAQMVQSADPGYLEADDLVLILQLISDRLKSTHGQSRNHIYQLTLAASRVLDAMADTKVTGLSREDLHLPLSTYLDGLKKDSDPCMVYQAAYAYQALICVPDDESLWKATIRRTGKVIKGVSGLVSAVKGLDLNGFIEGLGNIQQGLEGVSEAFDVVKTAYQDVNTLVKSGKNFIASLKEGFSFRGKCAWYSALRGADELIRDGEFVAFKTLVCEAPCRLDLPFQWGVCQRLGEIAANPAWDVYTRRNAVSFLGEMYLKDEDWGHQDSIKTWILDILLMLSTSSEKDLPFVETLLQELEKDASAEIKAHIEAFREKEPDSRPLKITFTPLESSVLLDRVQNKPDVEGILRQIKRHRQKERGESVFIQPQAKANLKASDDDRFDLMNKVQEFTGGNQKVFLLLGDSGSGKSTFNLQLECNMWNDYKKGTGVIPLHINLPAIEKPEQDMIPKQLRKLEFTEPEIKDLKGRRFLLICDGYDESQQTHNLYVSNRLNQKGEWQAQMVITCRTEYIGIDYRDRFQPGDRNNRSDLGLFQEAVMTPFTAAQVGQYVDEYVKVHQPLWEAKEYKTVLSSIPSLMELVKNPFLMTLSLEVLPRIVDPKNQQLSTTRVTRVALYDQFIVHWLERGKKRLSEEELSSQAKAAFQSLVDEGFTQNGVDFLKKLAVAIYREQEGQPVVKYSRFKDEGTWKSAFFSREDEKQLLREACPLTRSGNQHRFVHRSLLEYGLALAVFDPQEWKERPMSAPRAGRRGSVESDFSFHVNGVAEATEVKEEEEADAPMEHVLDPNSPLVWRYYVNEPSVIHFLAERAQQEPLFKQQLHDYIQQSKEDKEKNWRIAAANAISILVKAGEQFNGADLRGIQIPGADLSYGVFDSVQLQDADLRQVNLRGVWLRQADLSRAKMTSVQIGEMPYLDHKSTLWWCAYSPDGTILAVALGNGDIILYSTSDWNVIKSFRIKDGLPQSVVFSPKGDQIATGYSDNALRLWDVATGTVIHTMTGYKDQVIGVAFSPQEDVIASASVDATVRLWSTTTGEPLQVFTGHYGAVYSVSYSPDGKVLASGGFDKAPRLWDVKTGDYRLLEGHTAGIQSVAFAPQGHLLVSSSVDKTIRIWEVESGHCLRVLTDHSAQVLRATFSPLGDLISSASQDKTIRIWDTETGACRQILTGHTDNIQYVAFAPNGGRVASVSKDKTLRVWNLSLESSRQVSSDHNVGVVGACYLAPSKQVVSCKLNGTIEVWDAETGTCNRILRNHNGQVDVVEALVPSPRGDVVATLTAEKMIRLWNVESGECRDIRTNHVMAILDIKFSLQGNTIVTGSWDRTVKLWDVETGDCRHTLVGHSNQIRCVAFSPSGGQVASGSFDCTVRLWDVETGKCLHTLQDHADMVYTVAYSPNGDQVASGSSDMTVCLWDVKSGACVKLLVGHEHTIYHLAYSLGGQLLATAGIDKQVLLFDTETGECLKTLTGHGRDVLAVAISSKGNMIASRSHDRTVRLWDVASGRCQTVLRDFNGPITSIEWATMDHVDYLIIGCQDGMMRMWKVVVNDGDDSWRVQLHWGSTNGVFAMTDASIQGVHGLSRLNKELLKQRGAVGEPTDRLREVTKRVVMMTRAMSNLKPPGGAGMTQPTTSAEQPII